MTTAQNIKDLCSKLNRNMRTLKTPNFLKTFPNITTSKWPKRFHSIVRMVRLGITGFAILILWLLQQLQRLASCLYDGLKRLLTFILTNFWIQKKKTTLLLRIQTQYTSLLILLLTDCMRRELTQAKLSPSWIRLQKRSWNHFLIAALQFLLKL